MRSIFDMEKKYSRGDCNFLQFVQFILMQFILQHSRNLFYNVFVQFNFYDFRIYLIVSFSQFLTAHFVGFVAFFVRIM